MAFILSLIPLYLIGNFHCLGMCGPLVMWLSKHPFRNAYFLGRLFSFTLVGICAGELGFILTYFFKEWKISFILSLLFGLIFIFFGLSRFIKLPSYQPKFLASQMRLFSNKIAPLVMKEKFLPIFIFGTATIVLPCGQSLMVFSLSALTESPLMGGINAAVFALLTTPSLWFAMQASSPFKLLKKYYQNIMGSFTIMIGILSLLRAFASEEMIPHLSFTLSSNAYPIVIF